MAASRFPNGRLVMATKEYVSQLLAGTQPGRVSRASGLDAKALLTVVDIPIAGKCENHLPSGIHLARLSLLTESQARPRDQILDALADLLLALWPDWLPGAAGISREGGDAARAAIAAVSEARAKESEVFGPWLSVSALRAFSGTTPRTPALAPEIELREQVRAVCSGLAINHLCLAVEIEETPVNPSSSMWAEILDWAARHGNLAILVCGSLAENPTLARFPLSAFPCPPKLQRNPLDSDQPESIESNFQLATVEGRPNPSSKVETLIAQLLKNQAWTGVYAHNRLIFIDPLFQARPDLVWPSERVIVELDGPDHHAQAKYAEDRDRDFRLSIWGYRILRLTNKDVLADSEKALTKIRKFLDFCRSNPYY